MSTRAEIAERVTDAKCRLLDRYAWACKLTEAMAECERRNEVRGAMENDERARVARRLREEADYPGHAVQYMEQFISDLRQLLFGDLNPTADYSEMFARLADLIEPSDLLPEQFLGDDEPNE